MNNLSQGIGNENRMDKTQAIIIAAEWWANMLRAIGGIMIDLARTELSPLKERQICNFQAYLEDELVILLKNCIWDIQQPARGEYLRIISVDWQPDIYLMAAVQKANVNSLWLPVKTRMWISPDAIKLSVNGLAGVLCPECRQVIFVIGEGAVKCHGCGGGDETGLQ